MATTGGNGGHGGGGHGGGGGNNGNVTVGFGGFNNGYYNYPYNTLYTIPVSPTCTTIYDNQSAINSANAQLTACNNIGTCNASTVAQINQNLSDLMAVAKPIGNTCSNGVNVVGGVYPTTTLIRGSIL